MTSASRLSARTGIVVAMRAISRIVRIAGHRRSTALDSYRLQGAVRTTQRAASPHHLYRKPGARLAHDLTVPSLLGDRREPIEVSTDPPLGDNEGNLRRPIGEKGLPAVRTGRKLADRITRSARVRGCGGDPR